MSKMRKEYDPNKIKRRKRKTIVYIICEGKEIETLYFKHFRSRNCLVDIIPISSKHKAAEHLVKHAKALIYQADYYPKDGDQLWCLERRKHYGNHKNHAASCRQSVLLFILWGTVKIDSPFFLTVHLPFHQPYNQKSQNLPYACASYGLHR